MGTRCLTVLNNNKGKEIAVLYRQSDGYPDGHGVELAKFLSGHHLCNGISQHDTADNAFNGMDDCAARVVSHFKGGQIGQFYLHAAGTRDVGEEYIYTVSKGSGDGLVLRCVDRYRAEKNRVLYEGPPEKFEVIEEPEAED